MRLSIEHRRVVITIYLKNNLHLRKNRIDLLRQLALEVDIEASDYSGLAFDYSELAARCSMAE